MTHGSLFSGIGGFDLASEWMGWENKFHCEWNPFGQKILKYYWPKAISYEDITKTDFTIHRGKIDILTGGFPCQPYSSAGKRKGKDDERHLWPHMLRAISEIKPSWVVGENVRGLVNWNEGMVFHEVQSDLENQGYAVQSFLIPAAGMNTAHQRYRIWFIAYNATYTNSNGLHKCNSYNEIITGKREINPCSNIEQVMSNGDATNTEPKRLFRMHKTRSKDNINRENTKIWGGFTRYNKENHFINFPTQSPICGGNDGLPNRLDNITFPKWRKESIRAYGNAIVPQVALNIFKAINEYERINCITNNNGGNKNTGK